MRWIVVFLMAIIAACSPHNNADAPVHVVMTTDKGAITLELYPAKAPKTVANFLRYADEGLFDGATFYRATTPENDGQITVIQGGLWRPWEPGMDEGFVPPLDPIEHETTDITGLTHGDGVISMARDEPGSAASEIFITIGDNHMLDFGGARNPDGQGFAAFGKVIDGMGVVRAINAAPTRDGEGFAHQLLVEPVKILSVERKE